MRLTELKHARCELAQDVQQVDETDGGWATFTVVSRSMKLDWPHTTEGNREAAAIMRQMAKDLDASQRRAETKTKRKARKH